MQIAFLITRGDAVGGATIHVRDIAQGLKARGAEPVVLIGGEGESAELMRRAGIITICLKHLRRAIRPWRDALAIAEIVNWLNKLKPQLVSTHTSKAGLTGRLACAVAGVPAIYTPHGWTIGDRISARSGAIFRQAERLAAPLSSRIVNVCNYERNLAMRYHIAPASRLAVVYNGVPDVDPLLRANAALDPVRIAMVARMEDPKDHATLLNAAARVSNLPFELELIGNGPQEGSLRKLAATLGIESRVRFTGGSSAVAERLAQAQMFVLATRSEGFPRSILEAMRARLPVIASNAGGVSEAVEHGVTGLLVPVGDVAAMANALAVLVSQPSLRARFGEAGRRRYEARFTFDRTLDATIAIYQEVLWKQSKTTEKTGESKWQPLSRFQRR